MLARTNYQLIFHERGPGLRAPTTEYRLAKPVEKLVIQLSAVAERTRFIFLFFFSKPCRDSSDPFLFFLTSIVAMIKQRALERYDNGELFNSPDFVFIRRKKF